jgi:hypothetical protein
VPPGAGGDTSRRAADESLGRADTPAGTGGEQDAADSSRLGAMVSFLVRSRHPETSVADARPGVLMRSPSFNPLAPGGQVTSSRSP